MGGPWGRVGARGARGGVVKADRKRNNWLFVRVNGVVVNWDWGPQILTEAQDD